MDRTTSPFHQARAKLQAMGPEVDRLLVELALNPRERVGLRSDALILLADREAPAALSVLSQAFESGNERIRSAAVIGFSRISRESPAATVMIREATRDRSRMVRLSALQSLDEREVATIRRLLERERDPQLTQIALQLVSLAESRGAPLAADPRGALRTAGGELEPQIVFRPVRVDRQGERSWGDLRIELPVGPDIPLASSALVVAAVVPAFFSPDRSAIVVENAGSIEVYDVAARRSRTLGPGIAPRPIPFSHDFVYLRESQLSAGTAIVGEALYDVYRGSFSGGGIERIGNLRAEFSPDRFGGESPVRVMIVAEAAEGFVLRGPGIEPLQLPAPVWSPGRATARQIQ
jgi:hypothetical protein